MTADTDRYSVWMVPKGKTGARLRSYINRIGAPVDAAQFTPHITLVGGVSTPAAELGAVRQRMQELAGGIGAFSVRLTEFGMLDEENRSLFLRAESESFEAAYAKAAQVFPDADVERFRRLPHLSVLYGLYPPDVKHAIIAANPLRPIEFTVGSFDLYHTGSDKSAWEFEQSFPLTSS